MQPAVHIIIVTHNSQKVVSNCIEAIRNQSVDVASTVVVDSGSSSTDYLAGIEKHVTRVCRHKNVGFSKANNIGLQALQLQSEDLVLFLNPDAFLETDAIEKILTTFKNHPECGAVGGKLLHYDLDAAQKTTKIDSTGIFRKWYGRWFDRGLGEEDLGQYDVEKDVPGICGALLCCSVKALQGLDKFGFNEAFFMYKEDIELAIRLRKNGWKLRYNPNIIAYHCRGWETQRSRMPYAMRLMSARNELKMYCIHPSFYIFWAALKFLYVRFLRK